MRDNAALSSMNGKDIDRHVWQALDLEHAEVVVELRHHNKGHMSKYEPFWEVFKQYIKSSVELAVDDRWHGRIACLVQL